jgi:hypothetical protein
MAVNMDNYDDSLTISEFCRAEKVCHATFYNLKKAGKGPRLMKVGSHYRISPQAWADWRRAREAEAAAEMVGQ